MGLIVNCWCVHVDHAGIDVLQTGHEFLEMAAAASPLPGACHAFRMAFPCKPSPTSSTYSTHSAFIAMFQAATGATPNAFRGLARDEDKTSS